VCAFFWAVTATNMPAEPHDEAKLMQLRNQCTTFLQQAASADALYDLLRRKRANSDRLAELDRQGESEYAGVGQLMLEQQVLEQELAQLPLSQGDLLKLGEGHAALVQDMRDMCRDLVRARQHSKLKMLAAQLAELKATDLSAATGVTGKHCALQQASLARGFLSRCMFSA
jgi:small-conductance mechanosensitive channel